MNVTLEQVEADVQQLTLEEQTLVLERLARSIRERSTWQQQAMEQQLDVMAADTDIQRDLKAITVEFEVLEIDGL